MHVFRWILAFGNVWHLSSKQVHYPEYVHACLCWCGSHCFTQDSARLPERRRRKKKTKMNNLRGRRFRFITLETSVSPAKGLFKLRKFAWSFLDGRRHLDLRRRTSDFGDFNGLLGSAYPQEKSCDSSFSAKSSRHFESRSSLHVSDLAALTIVNYVTILCYPLASLCTLWSSSRFLHY